MRFRSFEVRAPLVCSVLPLVLALSGVVASAQDVTRDPDRVRLEVQDIRRLAAAIRSLEAGLTRDTVGVLEREYLALASPGLRAYAAEYSVTAESIAAAMTRYSHVYSDLDALADTVLAREQAFRTGFRKLQELFPGAAFPPVWFVVGHHGPGGLTRPEGALIAAERYTSRPDDLVPLVLHEFAHFQQAMVQGVDAYRRIYGPDGTLLALALREGSAELIAELTTGAHTNPAAGSYGAAREGELWQRFSQEMRGRQAGDWMFARPSTAGQPPDLGYWIGYRMVRSYYDRAEDKRQAIRDILALTDWEAFLEASGYSERFPQ